MMFDFPSASDKDLPLVKQIKLQNNVIYIKKQDPYGFWTVNFDSGRTPPRLRGQFMSDIDAEKEVMIYLRQKGRLEEMDASA
jgi:hypothetical protein